MKNYYDLIMGTKNSSFLPIFNEIWKEELISHNMKYENAKQLTNGNRLRPALMAWGYYSHTFEPNNHFVANCAVCVELIHKASILLDDYIDDDAARHGLSTFHTEYSNEEAILYAIFLINKSLKLVLEKDFPGIKLLINTINDMAIGCLKEITASSIEINDIKEIISLETTVLIENSFTLGYCLAQGNMTDIPEHIVCIGKHAGYCFQLLNDLEPFMNLKTNINYKGGSNYDFNKNRKNIVLAYLYGNCSKRERTAIFSKNISYSDLNQLIIKYDILAFIFNEIEKYLNLIKEATICFKNNNNLCYYNDFQHFIKNMFTFCYRKLGIDFEYSGFDN